MNASYPSLRWTAGYRTLCLCGLGQARLCCGDECSPNLSCLEGQRSTSSMDVIQVSHGAAPCPPPSWIQADGAASL